MIPQADMRLCSRNCRNRFSHDAAQMMNAEQRPLDLNNLCNCKVSTIGNWRQLAIEEGLDGGMVFTIH